MVFGKGGIFFQFNYGLNGVFDGKGNVMGCILFFCVGGDLSGIVGGGMIFGMNMECQVVYLCGSYEFNDDYEVFFMLNYGKVDLCFMFNFGVFKNGNFIIQCDNFFLLVFIVMVCVVNNIISFKFGIFNVEFFVDIDVNLVCMQVCLVFGVNGYVNVFGKDWIYEVYVMYGQNIIDINVQNMMLNKCYEVVIDVVCGFNGSIICCNVVVVVVGCVLLNVIGDVFVDFVVWVYIVLVNGLYQYLCQCQMVVSFSVNGEFFLFWVGLVVMVFGVEVCCEQYYVMGDFYGNGGFNIVDYLVDFLFDVMIGNNWYVGNYYNVCGVYYVKEVFFEFNVLMFKFVILGEVNFNIVDCEIDYSIFGCVGVWKVGFIWKIGIDGLCLCVVMFRDVCVFNFSEFFVVLLVVNNIVNYQGMVLIVQQCIIGNVNLCFEMVCNMIFGIVLVQLSWVLGFSVFIDYFDIKVKDVIFLFMLQQEVDFCVVGNKEICVVMDLVSLVKFVMVQVFNFVLLYNKGFDIEGVYCFDLSGIGVFGKVMLCVLVICMKSFFVDLGVVGIILVEVVGVNVVNVNNVGFMLKWKGQFIEIWDIDKVSLFFGQCWISDGVYSNEYIECQISCLVLMVMYLIILDNYMKGVFYWDIGGFYKYLKNLMFYFKVDNFINVDLVVVFQMGIGYGINFYFYDVLGCQYYVGVCMVF